MSELPGEDGQPDKPDWPETLLVPDDPSALEADMLALRRERQAERRRAGWRRLTGGDRLRTHGISIPVVVVALVLVSGFGALLVLLGPRTPRATPQPATAAPTAQPGRPGGRLPAVSLRQADGTSVTVTNLTMPGVLLLVPADCGCAGTVDVVVNLAARGNLRAYVVEPAVADAAAVDAAGGDRVVGYTDPAGTLLSTYGSTGAAPTLLLLDGQGAVRTVTTGVTTASAPAALADLPT